jgi:hypothetical protein
MMFFLNQKEVTIKIAIRLIGIMLCLLAFNVFAQQSGGGGSELKNTCEVSGGTYTESSL